MANSVITSSPTFIDIDFGDTPEALEQVRIRKTAVKSVMRLADNCGVVIDYGHEIGITLCHTDVDEIDGDTNISSEQILYDKLKALM